MRDERLAEPGYVARQAFRQWYDETAPVWWRNAYEAARQRAYYWRNRDAQVARVQVQKRRRAKMMRERGGLGQRDFADLRKSVAACEYCGCKLRESNWATDHKQPLSLGGANTLENIAVCCTTCNATKGVTPWPEWSATLPRVVV